MTTVIESLTAMHDALDAVPLDSYAALSSSERAAACESLMRLEARVKAHQMAAARSAHETGTAREMGASSTGQMLANSFGGDRRAGDRLLHQAERVSKAPATESALAEGEISIAQADVIASTIDGLPADVTPE